MVELTHRKATTADIPALTGLMERAISGLMGPFLSPAQIKASYELMGLDSQLVTDGTYFVIQSAGRIVGCGGWSNRATLFGGNHTQGRDATFLNPACDAARVRAMYTEPAMARVGIGRRIINICENAAHQAGFRKTELVATMAGVPLYKACGYSPIEAFDAETSGGVFVPLLRMGKVLSFRPGGGPLNVSE